MIFMRCSSISTLFFVVQVSDTLPSFRGPAYMRRKFFKMKINSKLLQQVFEHSAYNHNGRISQWQRDFENSENSRWRIQYGG